MLLQILPSNFLVSKLRHMFWASSIRSISIWLEWLSKIKSFVQVVFIWVSKLLSNHCLNKVPLMKAESDSPTTASEATLNWSKCKLFPSWIKNGDHFSPFALPKARIVTGFLLLETVRFICLLPLLARVYLLPAFPTTPVSSQL